MPRSALEHIQRIRSYRFCWTIWFRRRVGTPAISGQEVIVSVPKGASLSQVGGILQENGVVSSRLVFKLVAIIRGEQRKIKAGDYALKTGSDAGDVLDQLISGKTLMFSITVPEGYDMYQIADLLQQSEIMSKEEFIALCQDQAFLKELGVEGSNVEGYLFPDTYSLEAFGKRRRETDRYAAWFNDSSVCTDKTVRQTAEENAALVAQVLTLASLIEKEARASEHALRFRGVSQSSQAKHEAAIRPYGHLRDKAYGIQNNKRGSEP